MTPTAAIPASTFNPVRFWIFIGSLCAVVLTASLLLHQRMRANFPAGKALPILAHIEHDCEATERSGAVVHTSALRGKVCAIAYVYTVCPHGCAVVIGEMLKLKKEFARRSDFQLVSVSVVPERDNAAFLRSYAKGIGLKPSDPWWFLTGDQAKLWGFMTNELKLQPARPIPENERLSPLDLYIHDLRIVLVDRSGNVRGYYAVFHPEPEIASLYRERLQNDARTLLNEAAPPASASEAYH